MRFNVGDRVKLNKERKYVDGSRIPVGAKGTVLQVYPVAESYLVEFDKYSPPPRKVHELFLDPA